jgi:uncharacterized 2Fe-2S/4Fe-4S cluster protein (DUF4445 family)
VAIRVKGSRGQSVLEALRAVFQNAHAPCGGSGLCGRCRVLVQMEAASGHRGSPVLSDATGEEARLLGPDYLGAGWRLACLARFIRDGSLELAPEEWGFFNPEGEESEVAGAQSSADLCAAVDIGTTTIACALAEKNSGKVVARIAAANRQRSYGFDPISRIESALRAPENLSAMQQLVRTQVGFLLGELHRKAGGVWPDPIHLCGNTTMLHLWEGEDVAGLGSMPFRPAFLDSRLTTIRADSAVFTHCRLLPGISAFIGSDITAGILACGLLGATDRPELLVDLGTNNEIVLATGGRLLATATAAGPAFEGAAISCGIPAVIGAVNHVTWEEGRFFFTTLGAQPATGICGSGLLDLLACLRRAGLLDEDGGLQVDPEQPGEEPTFRLPSDQILRLTQADIRKFQLAKGAIAAGIQVVCRRAGIQVAEISRVHLAGAFGGSLSTESALLVGLIPPELAGRIKAGGNTALAGALMSARDPVSLDLCRRIASGVQVIDLSHNPDFQDAFVKAMRFPVLPLAK